MMLRRTTKKNGTSRLLIKELCERGSVGLGSDRRDLKDFRRSSGLKEWEQLLLKFSSKDDDREVSGA
jgi:hypothetical protein